MKSYYFLILLININLFFKFGNAHSNEYALVLRKNKNELNFAWPATSNTGEFDEYFVWNNVILYLCPTEPKPALKIVTTFNEQQDYAPAKKVCDEPVEPTIFQVQGELQNDEKKNNIHLYHIGFLINDEKLRNVEKITAYVALNNEHHFMPMVSFYRDTELQQTIAASYTTTEVDVQRKLKNKALEFQHSHLFDDKIEQLYQNQESILKETFGDNFVENKHELIIDSLVSENDFIIDTLKKTAHFKVLQIPIWKENYEIWKNIREYTREVSKLSLSTQIITAGIGKALTLTYNENREYKMKWGEGKETIFIPELYWVAFEYRFADRYERTGIFIIMHNLPRAGEKNIDKICETNVCIENQLWFPTERYMPWKERVYCCPMDNETIKKLHLAFLLQERNTLDYKKRVRFPPTNF